MSGSLSWDYRFVSIEMTRQVRDEHSAHSPIGHTPTIIVIVMITTRCSLTVERGRTSGSARPGRTSRTTPD
jgi:hypothetical protein